MKPSKTSLKILHQKTQKYVQSAIDEASKDVSEDPQNLEINQQVFEAVMTKLGYRYWKQFIENHDEFNQIVDVTRFVSRAKILYCTANDQSISESNLIETLWKYLNP